MPQVLCKLASQEPTAQWLTDVQQGSGGRGTGVPHLVVSKPAATAHFSSLPDTSTAPLPKCCRCFMMMRLLLALMA